MANEDFKDYIIFEVVVVEEIMNLLKNLNILKNY
jgi:hypothetical protein